MNQKQIAQILKLKKSLIEREYLNRYIVYNYLYEIDESIRNVASYFDTSYMAVTGDVIGNIRFASKEGQRDYLIFSANSGHALPQQIAVGSEVNGKVYLMRENFPKPDGAVSTIIVPDSKLFEGKVGGFLPRSERRTFLYQDAAVMSDEELFCINSAGEAADRISKTLKIAMDRRIKASE